MTLPPSLSPLAWEPSGSTCILRIQIGDRPLALARNGRARKEEREAEVPIFASRNSDDSVWFRVGDRNKMTQTASYGLMPRILVPILAGGSYYLIAKYVFSDPDAAPYGIWITVGSGAFLILEYLFQKFRGIVPRILIPILAGALFYLIAHFVFSYSYAARFGIIIAAASGGLFIFQYLSEDTKAPG